LTAGVHGVARQGYACESMRTRVVSLLMRPVVPPLVSWIVVAVACGRSGRGGERR